MSRSVRTLAPFLRGRWAPVVGALAATLVTVAAELARPFPLKLVIDRVLGGDGAFEGVALTGEDWAFVVAVGGFVLVIAAADAAGTYVAETGMRTAAERLVHDLRTAVYSHLQRLSLGFHDRRATGDLLTRLTGDVTSVGELFGESLAKVLASLLLLGGMLAVTLLLDPVLAAAAFGVAPLLGLLTIRFRRRLTAAARRQRASEGMIATLGAETLASMRTVKALGSERFETDRLNRESDQRRRAGEAVARVEGRFGGLVDVLGALGPAAVLVVGVWRVSVGALTPGDLIVVYSYARRVYRPLRDLTRQAGRVARALARAERIGEVLAADEVLAERAHAYRGPRPRGELALRDVSFAYDSARGAALDRVDLRVPAGTRVAVVGHSGAGKSTLAALIARFHDPDDGAVLLDDRDLRDCSLSWLRDQVGLVLQDTALFSGTIAENIAYATDASRREVEDAARAAEAHEFVAALPQGYDTPLGAQGVALSGGQRQRVAIARVLLRDPPVLVLDEPTSGLDAESEQRVMTGLETLMAGRTTVLVTHSMRLARRADHVVVLDRGRVVEAGEPTTLLAGTGHLRRLAAAQGLAPRVPIPAPPDRALRHLPALLDTDAVADALGRHLETPLSAVRISYLRWKPATNALVRYDVDTPAGRHVVVAMTAADRDLARRASSDEVLRLADRAAPRAPARHAVAWEPVLGSLVSWLPADPWLPALATPTDQLGARLLGPGRGGNATLLAYRPRRRAVLRLDGHVIKLYAAEADFAAAAFALLAAPRLPVPSPEAVAIDAQMQATAQPAIGGRPVEALTAADESGSLLAALHATSPLPAFVRAVPEPLEAATRSARLTAALCPVLADRIGRLVARLAATRPPSAPQVLAHGDFHAGQLLDADDHLVLVDLDELGTGPAGLDLATYPAHLVDGAPEDTARAYEALDRLVAGYGCRPDDLDWYLAAAILRRAPFPLRRSPEPDWPDKVEVMVAAAEAAAPR
ncbi:MAG: ABC transporter transmembrane domain-containing protein [Acidimicrobiia bacterium]